MAERLVANQKLDAATRRIQEVREAVIVAAK